eukprot:CAMPEP_0170332658 /NCGR_PEP_ID=MMETSP0116_2-20130129/67336_1 /TAXON_ID=400756 /ORGANISM="Durinskia baltica, Strain CSIRO CS-38" /LENGTH=105 /DNA_ID=CAMNT_0010585975 /DNA_START=20 /DNA_END=333 /DNA_ORIENTATION=-
MSIARGAHYHSPSAPVRLGGRCEASAATAADASTSSVTAEIPPPAAALSLKNLARRSSETPPAHGGGTEGDYPTARRSQCPGGGPLSSCACTALTARKTQEQSVG